MTEEEVAAMDAYVSRRLDLPAPPTFLSCTTTGLKRAALLAFHQEHVEASVIADVPATVRLGRNIPRQSILRELVAGNAGNEPGKLRMKRFIKAAQRILFDGEHTLRVIFMSRRAAMEWDGQEFRLRGCQLRFHLLGVQVPGVSPPPELARHYALRVLGTEGLNPMILVQIFGDIAQEAILDVRHPGMDGLRLMDNDYWTVIFALLSCPAALQGVTSISTENGSLLLHHFQRMQSPPCRRCLSPYHLQHRCKVLDARLLSTRAPRQRRYVGAIQDPPPALPDCTDLVTLEDLLSRIVLDPAIALPTDRSTPVLQAVPVPVVQDAPAPVASVSSSDATGMTVVRRRRGAPAHRSAQSQADTTGGGQDSAPEASATSTGQTIGAALRRTPPQGMEDATARAPGKRTPAASTAKPKPTAAALRYQQTLAAYAELAGDSDDEEESDDRPTSAQSAQVVTGRSLMARPEGQETKSEDFPPSPTEPASATVVSVNQQAATDIPMSTADANESQDVTMEEPMPATRSSLLQSPAAGLAQTDHAGGPSVLTGFHSSSSETQPSKEPYWHSASPASLAPMDTDDIVAETASDEPSDCGSEGFVMEKVVAPDNPYLLRYQDWIDSLHGAPVGVPGNGQCLFLAFYASVHNAQDSRLKLTSAVITGANDIKSRVLDILMANLRYDVKLKLIDPQAELLRMYPDVDPPVSVEAAAAALYAHYAKAKTVSVATRVPRAFWAGAHVLRAMAIYLREPLYVWDVGADDTAHVQQYVYDTFMMPNGDRHETGIVHVLQDDRIRDIQEECFNQHVIPVMLLLKHTVGHFDGVQHGQTFHDWHAQPGPAMRLRLDSVHRKTDLPILPANTYDPESIAEEAAMEEQALLEEMGIDFYASGSQGSAVPEPQTWEEVRRVEPASGSQLHREVYARLLAQADVSTMDLIDRKLCTRLHKDNDAAFDHWGATEGQAYRLPNPAEGQRPWLASLDWLCDTPAALKHVLAYLPFPELAIQCCSRDQLARWGEREVYLQQVQALERIWTDDDSDDRAREYCYRWIEDCNQARPEDALEIARNDTRWEELGALVDSSLLRQRPLSIPVEHWFILHALPYAVLSWQDTAMGRAVMGARAIWYTEYAQIRTLCAAIADHSDWSATVTLPLGLARLEGTSPAAAPASEDSTRRNSRSFGNSSSFGGSLSAKTGRRVGGRVVGATPFLLFIQTLLQLASSARTFEASANGQGTTSSAGVGMLVHPQSRFQDLKPAFETYWSPHFMAATAVLDGAPVLFFNVYAPVDPAQREQFYEQLTSIVIPGDTHLYVGGDFNCTQGGLADRSYEPYADSHSSDGLTLLAHQWRLHDSMANSMPAFEDKVGLKRFYEAHHTHQYTVAGRGLATSRLDRWYANDVARPWMAATQVDQEGFHSDHRGIVLHLRSPTNPIRIQKEKRVFPVPAYARERADQFVKYELEQLRQRLAASLLSAQQSADLWDATKVRIRTGLLQVQRAAKRSRKNTYRKKIRRMYGRLRVAMENARVDVVDASGDDPSASPAQATVALITQQIATVKREWIRAKSCSLFQKHTWGPGKTTKQFFKRISCKFGDNLIPTLRSPNGQGITDSHAKAEALADAWSSIMQGDATPPEAVSRVAQWMEQDTGDDTAALGSSDLITEEAVAAALQACKADKACGPDRLGNDWYRANAEQLTPILTTLYKQWYDDGIFPTSFLDADIFCLEKSGNGTDPLNYRPLALLNTDYKILTRLLTTEVRRTLARRISRFQNGFVPGRQIHATIDYLAAAQRMAQTSPEARDALSLLLDFAKAYDSLDRTFLYKVLLRHGYPPRFVHGCLANRL